MFFALAPWTGTRTVLIAYTPQCMGKLTYDMIQSLEDHGFLPPLSQLPEFFVRNHTTVNISAVTIEEKFEEEVYVNEECQVDSADPSAEWEMFLDVSSGLVKVEESTGAYGGHEFNEFPVMAKAELGYVRDVERRLSELVSPLEVTYQVEKFWITCLCRSQPSRRRSRM